MINVINICAHAFNLLNSLRKSDKMFGKALGFPLLLNSFNIYINTEALVRSDPLYIEIRENN